MFVRNLFTAALALANLASALPSAIDTRDVKAQVSPNGDRVVVDAGGIYMRTVTLADGTLFGAYAASEGGNRVIRATKSSDKGASWHQVGTVTSGSASGQDIDNADVIELPGGRLLCSFRNHDRAGNGYSYYRITVCFSDDGGATWAYLSQADERGANGVNGLWEPFFRLSRDKTLQVFYSTENNAQDQDNVYKTSKDGGKTWSGANIVSGGGITSRDGMTGVANIDNNGNVICVFENTEIGHFTINYVLSQDDGFTWNSRGRVYAPGNGKDAGAPQVINVGGTLVASFMTNEDDPVPQVDGGRMKVVTSTDGGKTWGPATVTGPAGSHWPGLQTLDNSHFLALYGFNGQGQVSQKYAL